MYYLDRKTIKAKYKILSRKSCEKYCTQSHKKTSIIISIRSSWDRIYPNVYMDDKNNIKAILSLAFCDLTKEDSEIDCMSYEDGVKVAEFVNEWYEKVDTIIVHCDGGISRSAGVCAAIMRVKEGDDWVVFDSSTKHPNMTCYLRTLKGFNYEC